MRSGATSERQKAGVDIVAVIEEGVLEEPRAVARRVVETRLFTLLALAVCVDLLFIAIELAVLAFDDLAGAAVPGEGMLSLQADWGLPEIWRYLKTAAVVALAFRAWRREQELVFGSWALVFLMILADDAVLLHERLGEMLGTWLGVGGGGIDGSAVGSLFVWAAMGLLALSALVYGYQRSSDSARSISRIFTWVLGLLLFFALGLDTVLAVINAVSGLATGGQILEDGGELVVLSLALVVAAATIGQSDLPQWFSEPMADDGRIHDDDGYPGDAEVGLDLDAELVDLTGNRSLVDIDLAEGPDHALAERDDLDG